MRLIASPGSVVSPFESNCEAEAPADAAADALDVTVPGDASSDATDDAGVTRVCLQFVGDGGATQGLAFYRPHEPGEAFTLAGALYGTRDCAGSPVAYATLVVPRSGGSAMDAGTDAAAHDASADTETPDGQADAAAADGASDVPAGADVVDVASDVADAIADLGV